MSSPVNSLAQPDLKIGGPLMGPFKAAILIDLEVQVDPHALVRPVCGYIVNGNVFASGNRADLLQNAFSFRYRVRVNNNVGIRDKLLCTASSAFCIS